MFPGMGHLRPPWATCSSVSRQREGNPTRNRVKGDLCKYRCESLRQVLRRRVQVREGVPMHAGNLLLLPAGGLVPADAPQPGGLSATLGCEPGKHLLLLSPGQGGQWWPMGAGETPAAPCGPLATSCRHQWQGWGVPAGEELRSGSPRQPLSCSPSLHSSAWTCCVTFSVSRRCSAPATRDQAPWLWSLWLSMCSASSVWLGSATTATIPAPACKDSCRTWGAAPRVPTAASPRAGGGQGALGELGFLQALRASLSHCSPGHQAKLLEQRRQEETSA